MEKSIELKSKMLLKDAVPNKINVSKMKQYLKSLPFVKDIHDLHIWGDEHNRNCTNRSFSCRKIPGK